MKKLSELKETELGIIDSIETDKLGLDFTRDLLDYGVLPGTEVLVKRRFPNSEKLILQIGHIEIALRLGDANFIQVK